MVHWSRGTCISADTVKISTGGRGADGEGGVSAGVALSFTEALGESAKELFAGDGDDAGPEGRAEMELRVPHNVFAKIETHSAS